MDTATQTAIGAGYDALPADYLGVPRDPVCDYLRVLYDIRFVCHQPRDHRLACRKLHVFPNLPFVLVLRVRRLDGVLARLHPQHQVDDVSEWEVGAVRAFPTTPANMVSDLLFRYTLQGVVDQFYMRLGPFSETRFV